MNYWDWVRAEAAARKADGCTGVSEWNRDCCLEHDLAYRTKLDPRQAFERGWEAAGPISRAEADARFRRCNLERSGDDLAGLVRAWGRWVGVRVGGWMRWKR